MTDLTDDELREVAPCCVCNGTGTMTTQDPDYGLWHGECDACEESGVDSSLNRAALTELIRKRVNRETVIAFLRAQPDDELAGLLQEAFGGSAYCNDPNDPCVEFEIHDLAHAAADSARVALARDRAYAALHNKWPDDVGDIEWGVLVPIGKVSCVPDPEDEEKCDYVLQRPGASVCCRDRKRGQR